MSEKYTYRTLEESSCKVKGHDGRYGVFSTKHLWPGDIIEEFNTIETKIELESLFDEESINDVNLYVKTIPYVDKENKTRLCLAGGNYISYSNSKENNAIYQYDSRFDVVTIRAIKEINTAEEITLPFVETQMKQKPKNKKGCGCGKNKKVTETLTDRQKVMSRSKPPQILRDRKSKEEKQVQSTKFKSMETGEALTTIEVDK